MSTPTPTYEELLEENIRLKQDLEQLRAAASNYRDASGATDAEEAEEQEEEQEEEQVVPAQAQAGHGVQQQPALASTHTHSLSNFDIMRYGRQLILPEFGPHAQDRLSRARVLVVGAGGLGCPVVLYLAAAGVGTLGIVDGDTVDLDNLHRQVGHSEETLGQNKSESLRDTALRLNSSIECHAYVERFTSANAMDIAAEYDVIVDACDNVPTRYLVNDVGVLQGKPVVSGSALRMEGQATVYGYNGGPCYRCLYPEPPPPGTVTNCADGGVLGAVPGLIGCIQALEVIKICSGMQADVMAGRMLMFDGCSCRFMMIKLRSRVASCDVCGDAPTVTEPVDYVQFCSAAPHDKPVIPTFSDLPSISCAELSEEMTAAHNREGPSNSPPRAPFVLLDVRNPVQYEICHLPGSVNIPLSKLKRHPELLEQRVREEGAQRVFVYCRRGVLSSLATEHLRSSNFGGGAVEIRNVAGGLLAWTRNVDQAFPQY